MGNSIRSNPDSVHIQNQVRRTSDQLSKTFERLSSGLRINSASDDPAGLAVADGLRNQTALATVAIRNVNDGISYTSMGNAALDEISNILTRLSELANQGANSTYSISQHSAMQSEFVSLGSEVERIAKTTEFNGLKLLSNSGSVTIQAGLDGTSSSQISIEASLATLSALGLGNSGGALTYSIISVSVDQAVTASQNAITALTNAQNTLNTARGKFGAAESRLTSAVNFLSVVRENYAAAESRIRDADVAQEVANLVRLQTLQQAQIAVLAQANQIPSRVLPLLS